MSHKSKNKNNLRRVDQRNRQLRRGSVLSVILLLIVLIAFNMIFTRFLGPYTRFDWTANQAMTLGDESRQMIEKMESPVDIVVLLEESEFPGRYYSQVDFIEGLLKEYQDSGRDKIALQFVDPELNPSILKTLDPQGQYEGQLLPGRIAVHGTETGKLKILSARDFVNTQMNQQYQPMITGYTAEAALSGALNYVSSLETPVIYLSQGHGEADPESGFTFLKDLITNNNFKLETLDALSLKEIPEDARFIFLLNPQQDLTAEEAEIYIKYVKRGGNLLVLSDYAQKDFENLNKVLFEFNLKLTNNRVLETDPARRMADDSYTFLTRTKKTPIGNFGDNAWSIVGNARSVEEAGNAKEWIETQAVLQTGDQGAVEEGGNTDKQSAVGVQTVAMLSENRGFMDGDKVTSSSKALVLGSSLTFHDSIFSNFLRQSANYPLAVNAFNLLGEADSDRIAIRSKPVVSYALAAQYQSSLNLASVLTWVVLPLIFILIAIVVYRRRKNL